MAFWRRTTAICLVFALVLVFEGCTREENGAQGNYGLNSARGPQKVGVVLSAPGKSEPGYNEAVMAGVKKAADEVDAEYTILAQKDLLNNAESLQYLAENNYDMIVAIGRGMQEDLDKIAQQFPKLKFVIFDGEVNRPNVASVKLNLEEGAFMAGVTAASLTKSNIVGYVGGSTEAGRQMETAFAQGVQFINATEGKTVKINTIYAGVTEAAANDPERGKNLANTLYWTGSDVIFSDAGKLANGVAVAASENKKISISADLALVNTLPWNVYGALVQKRDIVVSDMTKKVLAGKLTGGRIGFGLADGAVDFVTSPAVPEEIKVKLDAIKANLKKGLLKPYTIQLPQGLISQINQMPVDLSRPSETGKTAGYQGGKPKNSGTGGPSTGSGSGTPGNSPGTNTNQGPTNANPGSGTGQTGAPGDSTKPGSQSPTEGGSSQNPQNSTGGQNPQPGQADTGNQTGQGTGTSTGSGTAPGQ